MKRKTRVLSFKDNTEMAFFNCGQTGDSLWLTLPDMPLMEAMTIFSDPKKTSQISGCYEGVVYDGYTELIAVTKDDLGIRVGLKQELSSLKKQEVALKKEIASLREAALTLEKPDKDSTK